ncbi:MAG TPA: Zn-dependent hydrolase [Thermoanaerobaculia bacterium]|nr:Zn-dependent hydrolase [Thermoanaerobaculia bacterium]
MPLDPRRTLADLRELASLTSDQRGAQRVAWTPAWEAARHWLRGKLSELPVAVEQDEAGNLWTTLAGASPKAVVIGGHVDSVPDGGWLDGVLDTLAGLECLRRLAAEATPPPLTVRLVDWADEEGAQFGRSLLGSSAASGTLDVDAARTLCSRDGEPIDEVLRRYGVELERMTASHRQLENAIAYLELHIEQGPVLEELGLPLGVVVGTSGVERHAVRFTGQAAHAGSTPMDQRRDAFAAAARLALEVRDHAREGGGVATVGRVEVRPGIPTAVAGDCEVSLDQRHLDSASLAAMLARARQASQRVATEERVGVAWRPIWRIDPIPFDPGLIELAERSVVEVAGRCHRLASGPLHDAAETARAGVPSVMLFVQSLRGLSHCKEEDSREEHLALSVRALDRLLALTLEGASSVPASEILPDLP